LKQYKIDGPEADIAKAMINSTRLSEAEAFDQPKGRERARGCCARMDGAGDWPERH